MNQLSAETRHGIEEALRCHGVCLATAMTHCLEMGGEHVKPQHFRLMMDCAAMCQLAADLMAHKSQFHRQSCAFCADICEVCARDCEHMEGMEDCAAACRSCAQSCRAMV
ncbi:MAG TPA: four-helix bundle copper-binding protein [Micropepsaceae bacterium]|jgi:hypothetical protein